MRRRILSFGLAVLLMFAGSLPVEAAPVLEGEGAIALWLDRPWILSGSGLKPIDSENPQVVPFIYNDRALVPLRAISEHFGADVFYRAAMREAVIVYGGRTYAFPIGLNHYRIEEEGRPVEVVLIDTETRIVEDRTMVPLRVVSEAILGLEVDYLDRIATVAPAKETLDQDKVEAIKTLIEAGHENALTGQ